MFNSAPIIFPDELRSMDDRPTIQFTAIADTGGPVENHTIVFPMPAGGVMFSDGGGYSEYDLGNLKNGLLKFSENAGNKLNGLVNGSGRDVSVGGILREAGNSLKNVSGGSLATAGAGKIPIDGAPEFMSFLTRKVENPHKNTTFNGTPVRRYSFAFKLVASSKSETETIRKIHTKFRNFVYPERDPGSLTLTYPPVWNIRFMFKGKDNKYVPKIYDCFLESVVTTLNPSAPSFHYDGSPVEVDFNVNFIETKAMTRSDIVSLESSDNRNTRRPFSWFSTDLGDAKDFIEGEVRSAGEALRSAGETTANQIEARRVLRELDN